MGRADKKTQGDVSLMRLRALAGIVTAFGLVAVIGCETPAPPPVVIAQAPPAPPPPAPVPPPPPPTPVPPPPIALSNQIVEMASTYRAVMTSDASISPNFTSGEDVARAVRASASYEQHQLEQGAVAYAAIAALQEPSFVAAIREYAKDPVSRADIAAKLLDNRNYVTGFAHVDRAAGLAIAALDGTGAQVTITGRAVKQAAYDVQRQAWSKAKVADAATRLNLAKDLSQQRLLAGPEDVATLRRATVGEAALSLAGAPVAPPYTSVVSRGLTIAALAALGMAGDDQMAAITPMLSDEASAFCLNMAKLNLYQCLAVSGPHYEDIFCMGQHALIDTGQCMIKAAGSPNPVFVEPPAPVAPAPKAKGRSVPVKARN